jgi:hypothetical protein
MLWTLCSNSLPGAALQAILLVNAHPHCRSDLYRSKTRRSPNNNTTHICANHGRDLKMKKWRHKNIVKPQSVVIFSSS